MHVVAASCTDYPFDAGPDLGTFVLTFELCPFGVSLLSTGANIFYLHRLWL